jgi:hypothetical protein
MKDLQENVDWLQTEHIIEHPTPRMENERMSEDDRPAGTNPPQPAAPAATPATNNTVVNAPVPGVEPVELNVIVSHICGEKIEQCCNYEIRGKGTLNLHITSPTHRLMSHLRDTGAKWFP